MVPDNEESEVLAIRREVISRIINNSVKIVIDVMLWSDA